MAINYTNHVNTRKTAQTTPVLGKDQVKNSAGGYVFEVNNFVKLDRFLILGTEGGSYYATERELTQKNATAVLAAIKEDGVRVVKRVVEISDSGRAPKNDPALFVLAMCMKLGDQETRKAAGNAVPSVARTGTHILHLAEYVQAFGGWGRLTKRAFANWYLNKPVSKAAVQIGKYYNRDGWKHADVLRLAHVKTAEPARNTLFRYAGAKYTSPSELDLSQPGLEFIEGCEKIKTATSAKEAATLITKYSLPREVVPTQFLNDPIVWNAMLPHMGLTAIVRNLGKMGSIQMLAPLSDTAKFVISKITDKEELERARMHPVQLLMAQKVYQAGRGMKGSNTWTPVTNVVDALEEAFYASFKTVVPTGKNIVLALDISGSMGGGYYGAGHEGGVGGIPGFSPREASAAMALVTAATEKNYAVMGFSHNFIELDISPKMRLQDAVRKISGLPFGSTDCSLPILWADKKGIKVDAFCVYTDNETYAGSIHPFQALKAYRQKYNIFAKEVVVGMIANDFSIADPNDPGSLDVVGFDTNAPALIADFIRE